LAWKALHPLQTVSHQPASAIPISSISERLIGGCGLASAARLWKKVLS
jgi:hypothetical protein